MRRREFLGWCKKSSLLLLAAPVVACGRERAMPGVLAAMALNDDDYVVMYDTHAMALYSDGTLGPKTGVILVDYVIANQAVELQFWHGHGGEQHRYVVTPEHFASLKAGTRVVIETTVVQGHTHKLFIDPSDPRYRVAGAQPVRVPRVA